MSPHPPVPDTPSTQVIVRAVPSVGDEPRKFPGLGLQAINGVEFIQDAAVLAYIIVHWIGGDGKTHSKDLGPWKAIDTSEKFDLTKEGVPDGVMVQFSSYVSAVGEYTNDRWFTHDSSATKGVIFRQTGTAFKGWFDYVGLYDI